MSLAIAHFACGVIGTSLAFAVVAPRLLRSPTLLVCGGVWGMIPDSHWVLPTGSGTMRAIHDSVLSDVFWFHGVLDRVDPSDSRTFAAALIGSMLLTVALTEWYARSTTRTYLTSSVEPLE